MGTLALASVLSGAALSGAALAGASPDATAPVRSRRAATAPTPGQALDTRVKLLAKELDLDETQQSAVRSILEQHRSQVARAWSDAAVPAALRVSATQAIDRNTAEQIRALLNDTQRNKYSAAYEHETQVGAPGADVQKWMEATRGQ